MDVIINSFICIVTLNTHINFNIFKKYYIDKFIQNEHIININKTSFGNQFTIVFEINSKLINVKFFSNGKLQITGLSYNNYLEQIDKILKLFYKILGDNSGITEIKSGSDPKLKVLYKNILCYDGQVIIKNNEKYVIKCDLKKNNSIYIQNDKIVPLDNNYLLFTTKSHCENKKKYLI